MRLGQRTYITAPEPTDEVLSDGQRVRADTSESFLEIAVPQHDPILTTMTTTIR